MLLTAGLVVEYVFNVPGVGLSYWTAASNADYPVELGVTVHGRSRDGARQPARRPLLRDPRSTGEDRVDRDAAVTDNGKRVGAMIRDFAAAPARGGGTRP